MSPSVSLFATRPSICPSIGLLGDPSIALQAVLKQVVSQYTYDELKSDSEGVNRKMFDQMAPLVQVAGVYVERTCWAGGGWRSGSQNEGRASCVHRPAPRSHWKGAALTDSFRGHVVQVWL